MPVAYGNKPACTISEDLEIAMIKDHFLFAHVPFIRSATAYVPDDVGSLLQIPMAT